MQKTACNPSLQTSPDINTASGMRRDEANNLDLSLMTLNLYMMKEIRNKCQPEICLFGEWL